MKRTFRVRWLITETQPPQLGGTLTLENGILTSIGNPDDGPVEDLGDVLLFPSLVNAHTHLEFSDLPEPLGEPASPFPAWIRQVVRWRREQATRYGSNELADLKRQAIACGITESANSGVTAIGEIATEDWSGGVWSAPNFGSVTGTIFLELLGLAPESVEPLLQQAAEFLRPTSGVADGWRRGLSPHAPYTVHPQLLERACGIAAGTAAPVAMHLAESRDELQLLATGRGPLVEILSELNAWHPTAIPRNSRPLDYLRVLAGVSRSLVVHGNYLAPAEIEFVARNRDRMFVVYCPRTHSYFQHDDYPLSRLLDAGVRVAIGTDSRASNPDLNMLAELREAARRHPAVTPDAILAMGTVEAAHAIGCKPAGEFVIGQPFRGILIPINSAVAEPLDWLLRGDVDLSAMRPVSTFT